MSEEFPRIEGLFDELMAADVLPLARPFARHLHQPGVYVLQMPDGSAKHVGLARNLARRLANHFDGRSSTVTFHCGPLPAGCTFRVIVLDCERCRELLQAYAIGRLAPAHIGRGLSHTCSD